MRGENTRRRGRKRRPPLDYDGTAPITLGMGLYVVDAIPHDFALVASRTVFYGMAAAMALAFLVSLVGMPAGKVVEEAPEQLS